MSMNERDYNATYKILVLGESGVGKTSIIRRFTEEEYQESYISTIGIDSRTKVVEVEDEKVRLQIWDTAGQERFRTLTSAYYRGAMGIILVYDVTAEYSFSNISNWMDSITHNASPGVCQLLVANKIDTPDELRAISRKRGEDRAKECKLKFFETSAKEDTNVSEVFMEMAKLICENRKRRERENSIPTIVLESEKSSSRCC
ncbi:ras-related protein Rab-13-like [Hydractinia symbiolongicarpus]|uniref:ras-related protein Rab-13-like n=1 Tax=Hydractinia symbiolongicarpus TaxID=13093 RepID=UPI00255115FC|nr:ras-related protein Rab-13-like [Hydractinia symbiolongicarpus]